MTPQGPKKIALKKKETLLVYLMRYHMYVGIWYDGTTV